MPFPNPLVPPEVDLTDFPFMPIDVRRLRDSRLIATSTGDEFMAWMLLVCASWHQRPAGSLPDDDVELAQLAGFGRVVKEWKKLREGALYGWVKCSDGRLYHPHVAEKAAEAWDGKLQHQWRKECDRIRKENHKRAKDKLEELPIPTLVQWKAERNSAVESAGKEKLSNGIPAENPLIGTGTGTGTGILDLDPYGSLSGTPSAPPDLALVSPSQAQATKQRYRQAAVEILKYLNDRTGKQFQLVDANLELIVGRLKEGATVEQCRGVIGERCAAWIADPKMAEYLRPATLFNRTKFNSYLGNLGGHRGGRSSDEGTPWEGAK